MDKKPNVVISMDDYEKFMGYEKHITKLEENNRKVIAFVIERVLKCVDSYAQEYIKILKPHSDSEAYSSMVFLLESFKGQLIDINKEGPERWVDTFLKEVIEKEDMQCQSEKQNQGANEDQNASMTN